jgi:hypothetical protein
MKPQLQLQSVRTMLHQRKPLFFVVLIPSIFLVIIGSVLGLWYVRSVYISGGPDFLESSSTSTLKKQSEISQQIRYQRMATLVMALDAGMLVTICSWASAMLIKWLKR